MEKMEWIFVDGCSEDKTVEILKKFQGQYPKLIKILNNPQKIVPCAMNIGIASSCGRFIVRLDAHADYATDYISKCVYYLDNTDAENVGGVAETKAQGFMGNATVLQSLLGRAPTTLEEFLQKELMQNQKILK
jgi:glycosyltransferase involved in cell wall biosynthesis